MVKRAKVKSLLGNERTLSAECYSQDALVLGGVDSGRTQALRLAERDLLPVERCFNARVDHINREAEASHWIPAGHRAHGPEVEAGVASAITLQNDVLSHSTAAGAEQVAVDDAVAIPDLRVGSVHRGRDVRHPEVLPAGARRPGRGQLELTAVDEDAVGDHAQ